MSRVARVQLSAAPLRDDSDPFAGLGELAFHSEHGLAWTGWRPHLSGRWRFWRTGQGPLEVDGLCLTPRGSGLDPIPPDEDQLQLLAQLAGIDTSGYQPDDVRWPDHHVVQSVRHMTVGNGRWDFEPEYKSYNLDVVVIAADNGRWVLAWVVPVTYSVVGPPEGELIGNLPSDGSRPLRLVCTGYRTEMSCHAEVFDNPTELRNYVDVGGGHPPAAVALLRWAVDVAAEHAPELDRPTDAETV